MTPVSLAFIQALAKNQEEEEAAARFKAPSTLDAYYIDSDEVGIEIDPTNTIPEESIMSKCLKIDLFSI